MGQLDGKVAVVTGGSRGLGLAMVKALARDGARVMIASRAPASVDQAVAQVQAQGGQAAGMAVDVGALDQVTALAEATIRTFGRLDIWVNNAGTAGPYGATLDFSPETFNQVIQTNIMGTYYGSRVALSQFIAQGSGKLINLLGAGWNKPVPWQNAYASSKVWIRWFTRALAEETRGSGVGVYAFNPGMVLTELLTDVAVFENDAKRLERFPMVVRALARPPEIPAAKLAWLASGATDGKTGLEISLVNPLAVTAGFAREGLRALLGRPAPESPVKIRVVKPNRS